MSYLNPHTHDLDNRATRAVLDEDVERTDRVAGVLYEISRERSRQDAKWGEQNHPDGTGEGCPSSAWLAASYRQDCQMAAGRGIVTWRHILREEYAEALAEDDPAKLRAELIQVAAVAVAWVEAIDRRPSKG